MAPDASADDPAALALARAVYWAGGRGSDEADGGGTRLVREKLMEFAWLRRTDEQRLIPLGEPHLGASSRWKRRTKYLFFRVLRFMTARYDRLLADQADLTVALSERVIELENHIADLRSHIEDGRDER
jgi:hypothetical protein